MKIAQIDKLYDKLTLQERAALGFEASIRQDEAELDAILKSVPRLNYSGLHREYFNRSIGLELFAADYGLQYWQHYAMAFMAAHIGKFKSADSYLTLLASMEAAVKIVCQQTKLDMAVVKKHAECEQSLPGIDDMVNEEIVKAYVARFMKQITFTE